MKGQGEEDSCDKQKYASPKVTKTPQHDEKEQIPSTLPKVKKTPEYNENELETPGDENSGGDEPITPTPPKVMKTPEHHENKLELLKGDEESPLLHQKLQKLQMVMKSMFQPNKVMKTVVMNRAHLTHQKL